MKRYISIFCFLVVCASALATTFKLKTSGSIDTSKKYLIVYKESSSATEGILMSSDFKDNSVSGVSYKGAEAGSTVTISNNQIVTDEANAFTLTNGSVSGYYYIKNNAGYYFGNSSNNFTVSTNASSNTIYNNSVTVSTSGQATIYSYGNSGRPLRYTNNGNTYYFRYTQNSGTSPYLYEEYTPQAYNVTVAPTTNGSVSVDNENPLEGATVTITATPNSGYELATLTVTNASGEAVTVTNNTFTMPSSNVTVTATFQKKGQGYEYIVDATNGTFGHASCSSTTSTYCCKWTSNRTDPVTLTLSCKYTDQNDKVSNVYINNMLSNSDNTSFKAYSANDASDSFTAKYQFTLDSEDYVIVSYSFDYTPNSTSTVTVLGNDSTAYTSSTKVTVGKNTAQFYIQGATSSQDYITISNFKVVIAKKTTPTTEDFNGKVYTLCANGTMGSDSDAPAFKYYLISDGSTVTATSVEPTTETATKYYWVISKKTDKDYYISAYNGQGFLGTENGISKKDVDDAGSIKIVEDSLCRYHVTDFVKEATHTQAHSETDVAMNGHAIRFYHSKDGVDKFIAVGHGSSDSSTDEGVIQFLNYTTRYYYASESPSVADKRYYTTDFDITEVENPAGMEITFTRGDDTANYAEGYYATLNLPYATEIPEGVTAYKIGTLTGTAGSTVSLTELSSDGVLPCMTPVLLNIKYDDVENTSEKTVKKNFVPVKYASEPETGWEGTLGKKTFEEGEKDNTRFYVLAKKNGKVALYYTTSSYINPNKAYYKLKMEDSSSALSFSFAGDDEETTGISELEPETWTLEPGATIYNLNGMKMEYNGNLPHGIYIINGRKVVK